MEAYQAVPAAAAAAAATSLHGRARVPGYAGYIPGVRPESDVFGKTFAAASNHGYSAISAKASGPSAATTRGPQSHGYTGAWTTTSQSTYTSQSAYGQGALGGTAGGQVPTTKPAQDYGRSSQSDRASRASAPVPAAKTARSYGAGSQAEHAVGGAATAKALTMDFGHGGQADLASSRAPASKMAKDDGQRSHADYASGLAASTKTLKDHGHSSQAKYAGGQASTTKARQDKGPSSQAKYSSGPMLPAKAVSSRRRGSATSSVASSMASSYVAPADGESLASSLRTPSLASRDYGYSGDSYRRNPQPQPPRWG